MQKKTVKKFFLCVITTLMLIVFGSTLIACDLFSFGNETKEEQEDKDNKGDNGEKEEGKVEATPVKQLEEKLNTQIDEVIQNNNNGTQTYGKFTDVAKESSYLGYGYNIVNSPYMDKNTINVAYPMIDPMKMQDVTLKMVKENRVHSYEIESSSMEEFSQSYSNKLSLNVGVGNYFSVGLSTMFGGSEEEKTFYKFYNSTVSVHTFNLYMVAYQDKLQDLLSSAFKEALLEMDPVQLFTTYGTHMINSVAMGGRMEANNVYSSTSKKCTNELEIAINSHAKAGLVADVSVENTTKYANTLSQNNVQNQTEIRQLGGKTLDVSTVQALAKNYQAWFESFYDDLGVSAVCGVVNSGSLTPVWELLPRGEETRAAELEAAFKAYSDENYDALLSKYKLKTPVPAKTYTINGEPQSCWLDNGYDVSSPDTRDNPPNDMDKYVCDLILNGCNKEGNTYLIAGYGDNDEISLGIKLVQDPNAIRIMKSGVQSAEICGDSATGAKNTNINKAVGKGAVYIRIDYTDMTTTEGFATNIFDGKTNGSYIDILSETGIKIDENRVVKSITVDVVYEIMVWWKKGAIWGDEYTNWRVHRVLNFQ